MEGQGGMNDQAFPDFESPGFLRAHIDSILAFYAPHVLDREGGFFHHFLDDGTIYDRRTRHLVSSTRFVFNYSNAFLQSKDPVYRDWVAHGMACLLYTSPSPRDGLLSRMPSSA